MNSDDYGKMIVKFDLYESAVEKLFETKTTGELKKIMVSLIHYVGLTGEIGELGEKIKKSIRDDGDFTPNDMKKLKECGDCEWYLTMLEKDLGFTKNQVLEQNYDKLSKRYDENKLHGSGDDR